MSTVKHFKQYEVDNLKFKSIFGTSNYLKSLGSNFGGINSINIKIAYYTNSILGIKRLTITALEATTDLIQSSYDKELDQIMNYFKKKLNISFTTCPPPFAIFPFPYNRALNAQFGTVLKTLEANEEELFSDIHPKHRNKIRKGTKEGLKFETGAHLKDKCYKIISDTLSRESIYFETKNEFNEMCNSLHNNIAYFVVKKGEEIHGAAVVPYNDSCAFYLWGGSIRKPSTGAMNYMHWEIMKFFKNINVESYDFVGIRLNPKKNTKLDGLRSFKTRFGGEIIHGFLWKTTLKPIPTFIFKTLYFIKNRALPSDIIESENKK